MTDQERIAKLEQDVKELRQTVAAVQAEREQLIKDACEYTRGMLQAQSEANVNEFLTSRKLLDGFRRAGRNC